MSHTKKEKSSTNQQGWTVKGIEIETRLAVQKAAKKEGLTLGQYCNTKLRESANNTLKTGSQLLVQPEDIRDEVKTQINALKQELSDIVTRAIKEGNPQTEKKNFLKKMFG